MSSNAHVGYNRWGQKSTMLHSIFMYVDNILSIFNWPLLKGQNNLAAFLLIFLASVDEQLEQFAPPEICTKNVISLRTICATWNFAQKMLSHFKQYAHPKICTKNVIALQTISTPWNLHKKYFIEQLEQFAHPEICTKNVIALRTICAI